MLINHRLAKLKYLHIDFVASIFFMQTIKISVTLGVIFFFLDFSLKMSIPVPIDSFNPS